MINSKYENAMSRHVESIPELILDLVPDLDSKAKELFDHDVLRNVKKIILTGCADSFAVVNAVRYSFFELSGVKVETVPSLDVSRFYPADQLIENDKETLLICFSTSGETSRIVEAAQRCSDLGCLVLAVTAEKESTLSKIADSTLHLEPGDFEFAPAVRTYVTGILSFLLVALNIGVINENISNELSVSILEDMTKLAVEIKNSIPKQSVKAEAIADKIKDYNMYEFIGAGQDSATAMVAQIQFLETIGCFATYNNTEDWSHTSIFMDRPEEIITFIISDSRSNALSRNLEVASYVNELTRPLYIVTDQVTDDYNDISAEYIIYPTAKFEFNNILSNFIPFALISSYLGVIHNEKFGRGSEGKWSFTSNGYPVKSSKIERIDERTWRN